jgi:hypothetical protein
MPDGSSDKGSAYFTGSPVDVVERLEPQVGFYT